MSQFAFIAAEWEDVFEAASKAENSVHADPRTACFYARRALELGVAWAYKHDAALRLPYQDNLAALIHEPSFKRTAGDAVWSKARVIVTLGNRAVHSHQRIPATDATQAVRELFHFAYWLARTYSLKAKPAPGLTFDLAKLPHPAAAEAAHKKTAEQLLTLESKLQERDENLTKLLADKENLDEELKRLRAEVEAAKAAATKQPDTHDYSEAQTRDYFIDLLLKEAGWPLNQARDREFEVTGMPNAKEKGFVDYVLWGDDGKPLALIEAKRTKRDPREGQQQAKLYADCLEKQFGQRPLIFYTNGYDHWFWDDVIYPPRAVQGFYKKAELELAIQRRTSRRSLASEPLNTEIVERPYQHRAIRRVSETIEIDHDRKALLVMATGAGKTRTVVALCDLLTRANWVKRVLFLADRVALVNQTVNVFKKFLPAASPVNLVTEKEAEGRVFVSTYPTMMGLINESKEGQRRFSVGHFDLLVIDEAHRSVFNKYGAIFDYFDSLLVGLTATPKDEIDKNTFRLFHVEDGVPTDSYSLEDAVKDKYLVPPKTVSVPLKFQREGITYDQLTDEEKDDWDALDWEEEEERPEKIEAAALNNWLFNADTVDKVLEHLMTRGQKVAGGDRLGKTIIFAKNQKHAEFIAQRFDINYPHLKGQFARVITFETKYAQTLINDFSKKDKEPHIAISVDMLDTGIDVPEVVNLVFFKMIRSKTKFWQMLGRGTRLCPDLFGPDQHKQFFYVFDYCQNLEFFKENPAPADATSSDSLAKRLFNHRLELISVFDKRGAIDASLTDSTGDPQTESELRHALAALLHRETAAMNLDNFVVRPHRRLVEKFAKRDAWDKLSLEEIHGLSENVAGLPTQLDPENEDAKRFDLLLLKIQLTRLGAEPGFPRLRDKVIELASLLEEKETIPAVREQMQLIQEVQAQDWWQDVTIPMLEKLRRRLRDLIKFIERVGRKTLYTDFTDTLGKEIEIELPGLVGVKEEKFRDKVLAFLREHQDHVTIHKLRMNKPLTASDLAELERILKENGVAADEELRKAAEESQGLGLFVRSLIGLDRGAAKEAMAGFLAGKTLTANQIEFVNLIIDHLTKNGQMDPGQLYESPFTNKAPQGPESLFTEPQLSELIKAIEKIREMATAA
jgi:type I restriction enzyme R subunit